MEDFKSLIIKAQNNDEKAKEKFGTTASHDYDGDVPSWLWRKRK